ncbi:MAG: hypothetical protein K9K32_00355 [Halanaerobiales bacterium]|nr:hypothetical protein [Halanaerobiales bacterium]
MKKYFIVTLILVMIFSFNISTNAYTITAKSYGMGGAYTGLAGDMTAVLYNPAGLNDSGFMGIQFDYGLATSDLAQTDDLIEMIDNLSEDFSTSSTKSFEEIDNLLPIIKLNNQLFVGGNFSSFGVGLNLTNRLLIEQENENQLRATSLTNNSGIITISREVDLKIKNIIGLSYGVNIKTLKTNYIDILLDDENLKNEIATAKGSSLAVDTGILINLTERIKFGVNFKNIIAPSYQLRGEKKEFSYDTTNEQWLEENISDYQKEYTPKQSYRVGTSIDIPIIDARIVGDLEKYTDNDSSVLYLGFEKDIIFNGLTVRSGMISPSDQDPIYTVGLGLNFFSAHLDLALGKSDFLDNNLNGALSINAQF